MLRRVLGVYYKVLRAILTVLIMALTVVVSYQVFSRYMDFVPSYPWTEEVARFLFIWMLFLGAAMAVREGAHFTVDLVPKNTSPKLQRALEALTLVLLAVITGFLLFAGLQFVDVGTSRIAPTSNIQLAWVYTIIPFAGFSMLIFVAERLMAVLRGESVQHISREESELKEVKQ